MSVWAKIVEDCAKPVPQEWDRPPTEKTCVACGEIKPIGEYYDRPTHSRNAVSSKCKACTIEIAKQKRRERKQKETT